MIRHTHGAAQRAFRLMLEHYLDTGRWDATLMADWRAAEDDEDALEEWQLDAIHEATMADLDDLAAAELPDVPLAAISESEFRALWGDR